MRQYKKWLSKEYGEVGWLAKTILVLFPAFPCSAFYATLSWVVGLSFYRLCKMGSMKTIPLSSHVNVIGIGVALSLGQEWSAKLSLIVCVAAITTVILTTMMNRLLYYYWIPVLLFPSLSVYWAVHSIDVQSIFSDFAVSNWNFWYGVIGAIAICAATSPIFVVMLICGLGVGVLWQVVFNSQFSGLFGLTLVQGVTFALCASVFSMPTKRSMVWATLAVGILSVCVGIRVSPMAQITVFKLILSANIGGVVAIYGARLFTHYTYASLRLRPEDKLEDKMSQWQRFRAGEARVGLPFKGSWKVSQSFNGEWTHRGIWQHGLDFVMTDAHNKSFRGSGYDLTDYYAFGKDVFSPTSGYVVAMFQDFPDNPLGSVQNQNNFGNYVIIRDAFGAHVLLGHLKQGSLTCALYQFVEENQVIGQCGNSGYSPEPHIHMHIQADAVVGSPTIAFHITNYLVGNQFHFHGVPVCDALITKLEKNTSLSRSLAFRVNESFQIITKDRDQHTTTKIANQLDPYWGSMYFTDGNAKLFHYRDALSFYFYRYEGRMEGPLFDLMTAMPRVPLIYGIECGYEDQTPVMHWQSQWQRWMAFAQLIVAEKFINIKSTFSFNCVNNEVKGLTWSGGTGLKTSCILDPVEGFVEFTIGERKHEVRSQREHGVIVPPDVGLSSPSKGGILRRII
jgi:murein DD-endopeptidase MepM/ murein hydrolase activator NlpD